MNTVRPTHPQPFHHRIDVRSAEARLLGILLPTMALLLDPNQAPPSALHTQTIAQVLTFATASAQAFKDATAKLPADAREVLEASVRQALGGSRQAGGESHKPQISLRSF